MENEKVKEIKEALYSWQESVMISTDGNYVSHKVYNREILDYINELESENSKFKDFMKRNDWESIEGMEATLDKAQQKCFEVAKENQQLKDRIAELEKENKRLNKAVNNVQKGFDNGEFISKDCQTRALKQFAEMLKEKFYYEGRICRVIIDDDVFDETLKEFL